MKADKTCVVLLSGVLYATTAVKLCAVSLTQAVLRLRELDGTNGVQLYHSSYLVFGPNLFAVWKGKGRVPLCVGDASVRLHQLTWQLFDWSNVDGTNGTRHVPISTQGTCLSKRMGSGYELVGGSSLKEANEGPLHYLRVTNESWGSYLNVTGETLACSLRYYVTNMDYGIQQKTYCGRFEGEGHWFAVRYKGPPQHVLAFSVSNLVTGVYARDVNDAGHVHFVGEGNPGYALTCVGDANGDGWDDLLIGSEESATCWLVFGGRGWSGTVALAALGTNGVTFHTLLPKPPWFNGPGAMGQAVSYCGDMNADGLDDFAYTDRSYLDSSDTLVVFGRREWPAGVYYPNDLGGSNGMRIRVAGPHAVGGNGDVNGDGHKDVVVIDWEGVAHVLYGGPFLRAVALGGEELNGVNGLRIMPADSERLPWEAPRVCDNAGVDISGDVNGDGVEDVVFSVLRLAAATNFAYVVYGGQSPSAPPQIRRPQWISVGSAGTHLVEWTDMPTNIVWTGCKKGDDYCLAYTNGVRCEAYDLPMGVLYFTNSYTLSASNEVFTIAYTSTNALGAAAGMTSLTLRAVPEAGWGGAALGFTIYKLQFTIWGRRNHQGTKARRGREGRGQREAVERAGENGE